MGKGWQGLHDQYPSPLKSSRASRTSFLHAFTNQMDMKKRKKKEERRKKKEEESGDLCEYKELFHGDWEEWTSSSAAL